MGFTGNNMSLSDTVLAGLLAVCVEVPLDDVTEAVETAEDVLEPEPETIVDGMACDVTDAT